MVHRELNNSLNEVDENAVLTPADIAASRLIIFHSLPYSPRQVILSVLFPEDETDSSNRNERFFDRLLNLSDQQYVYLIRMAIAACTDSKFPKSDSGYFLYQVASDAGLNIATIETEQKKRKQKERRS